MSVKLADTLAPMGDFPAAMARDVNIAKGGDTEKSLQAMYDDGELGGSGSLEFTGTKAEWEALTTEEKVRYDGKKVNITDDYVEQEELVIYDNLESFIDVSKSNVYYFGVRKADGTDYGGPDNRMAFGKVQVQLWSSSDITVVRCIQSLDYSTNGEKTFIAIRTGVYSDNAWTWGDWNFSNNNYSTNEEMIVGNWIDGKPIYRKVVSVDSLPDAGALEIDIGASNVNECWIANGSHVLFSDGSSSPIPFSSTGGENFIFCTVKSSTVKITTLSNRSDCKAVVVVEYTKTE